ncbi:MAG: glycoside hydrolase family 25 protein [Oscillospiraceae bacterium]|nr:glycoside hydrolase family 25 protein [Oscillospiraceae bacterium]
MKNLTISLLLRSRSNRKCAGETSGFLLGLFLITAVYISLTVSAGNANNTPDRSLMSGGAVLREPTVIKYGIDVSRWQNDIDWEAVAQTRAEFVMLRAAVGSFESIDTDEATPAINLIAEDSRFREYIAGAQENGLEVGVYLYSYAKTVREIKREARFFVNLLSDFEITYPVALDMEEERGHYTDEPSEMAEAFLEIIMDAGYFPMMYSYKSWLENYLTPELRNDVAVWVAQLDAHSTTYHGDYFMWQYSHKGRVSGIDGDVDLNIAYRDFADYIRRTGLNNL